MTAQTAALVLNTLLEEYLIYRRSVLVPNTNALETQRRSFEQRLGQADTAYNAFLTTHQIGDFTAEKASLSQLQAQIEQQQYQVQTQLQERQGRLATLKSQMAGVTPEIGLYHDPDPQPEPAQFAGARG